MPKKPTTKTLAFTVTLKVPVDASVRSTAASVRRDLSGWKNVRITPIKEA